MQIRETDSGQFAEAIGPDLLARCKSDESLWGAAVLFPIRLILWPDLIRERKSCVPIARPLRFLDSWKVRHQCPIRPWQFHWNDRTDTERVCALDQPDSGIRIEIRNRNGIPWGSVQIVCNPLAEQYLVIAHVRRSIGWARGS